MSVRTNWVAVLIGVAALLSAPLAQAQLPGPAFYIGVDCILPAVAVRPIPVRAGMPVTGYLKNMGIEQKAHQRLSKPSAIYCGSGSSKPERIFSLPFSKPYGSALVGALMGESRVLGVAVFVLTTNRLMGGDFACFAIQRSR